jgi:hypothetical protein
MAATRSEDLRKLAAAQRARHANRGVSITENPGRIELVLTGPGGTYFVVPAPIGVDLWQVQDCDRQSINPKGWPTDDDLVLSRVPKGLQDLEDEKLEARPRELTLEAAVTLAVSHVLAAK